MPSSAIDGVLSQIRQAQVQAARVPGADPAPIPKELPRPRGAPSAAKPPAPKRASTPEERVAQILAARAFEAKPAGGARTALAPAARTRGQHLDIYA